MARVMKNQVSLEWARKLGQAVEAWRKERGMIPTKLAQMLGGMSTDRLYAIRVAKNMSDKIAEYAAIHLLTGLKESDPRLVPPKIGGTGRKTPRVWSNARYQRWLKESDGYPIKWTQILH